MSIRRALSVVPRKAMSSKPTGPKQDPSAPRLTERGQKEEHTVEKVDVMANWDKMKGVGYETDVRKDKYLNPLLSPPPRSPRSPEDFRFFNRLGHWSPYGWDYTNQKADSYYFHKNMFLFWIGGALFFAVWIYGPDFKLRDWARREVYLRTNKREGLGLPLIDDNQPKSLMNDLEMKMLSMLPLRTASSLFGKVNSRELPVCMRAKVYDLFCRTYNCDMSEALESDYRSYKNFNDFFTRKLKPGIRPISPEPGVKSPADGLVSHFGPVRDGRIKGVKKLNYSVREFLGLASSNYEKELIRDNEKNELYNAIIYLSPGDYHRFHSPADWVIEHRKHFPGRLLSVKPSVVEQNPEVLHINERVAYTGSWEHGFFSMTAVGATNVGSIKVYFDEDLKTNQRQLWRPGKNTCYERSFKEEIKLTAGQDFGRFNFGSTIVLIFEAPKDLAFAVPTNQKIKYGQLLAKIDPGEKTQA